jgi:hypothetical protein
MSFLKNLFSVFNTCTHGNVLSRVCGDYYKTGIGLTTGFIGSHTVTHNYSVYALHLTIAAATLL